MGAVDAGRFHRLGLAVKDAGAAAEWYQHILGAAPLRGTERPHQGSDDMPDASGVADLEGADTRMVWHGGYPAIFLAASAPDGVVGRFLARWGPGVHSVAWEVADLWTSEHHLRALGIGITGVNVPGRHFFQHPRDTHGVLMEWTDTFFAEDHRGPRGMVVSPGQVVPAPGEGGGVVGGAVLAWVTAAVADAAATAAFLGRLTGAPTIEGNARRDEGIEQAVDVVIGDVTLRLVTPRAKSSRYHSVLAVGPRLWSYALRVPDLEAALAALDREGVETLGREGLLAWTDPAQTLGVPIEWTT